MNHYGQFIPNLATCLQPLNQLLHKGTLWKWSKKRETAFEHIKLVLSSSPVLAHDDALLPLSLAGGIFPLWSWRGDLTRIPRWVSVAHCLCVPYSHSQREDLPTNWKGILGSGIWCETFPLPVWMEVLPRYRLQTNMTTNQVADKAIPSLAAARLQRLVILLFAYRYDICFHRTEDHTNAD